MELHTKQLKINRNSSVTAQFWAPPQMQGYSTGYLNVGLTVSEMNDLCFEYALLGYSAINTTTSYSLLYEAF